MRHAPIHYQYPPSFPTVSICGIEPETLTNDQSKVTCKNCLRAIYSIPKPYKKPNHEN